MASASGSRVDREKFGVADEDMPVVEEESSEVSVQGTAALVMRDGGPPMECSAPLRVTVGEGTRWEGRPDREPVESAGLEVRRFMRRALYTMRPDPVPRPIRPYPKSEQLKPKPKSGKPADQSNTGSSPRSNDK